MPLSSSSSIKNLSFIFSTIIITFITFTSATKSTIPLIGINYRSSITHLPHQQQVVSLLETLKITSVRLREPEPDIIRSFSYSDISLLLTIPNSFIPNLASNQSEALRWLNHHVTPFHPRVHISTISVGNNVLDTHSNRTISHYLISALQNVRKALDELGIHSISVSSTFSFISVITTAFPPSSAEFKESLAEPLMKPLLRFLVKTNSSFLINLYPYYLYKSHATIPLGFTIFQDHPFNYRDDPITGVQYHNLFDMMVDSVFTSMALLGHEDVPIVVTETGWPSVDGTKDVRANRNIAEMYIKGLVEHLKSGVGTPLSKDGLKGTYIFELFDEVSSKRKRQWGILNADMSQKYNVDFSSSVRVYGFKMLIWGLLFVALSAAW